MIYLFFIALWLFASWHLIAKSFPNNEPNFPKWAFYIPFVPIIYGLMFITAIGEICIGMMIYSIIYNLKQKKQ